MNPYKTDPPIRVLVPTDFSPMAQMALESIISLMASRPEVTMTLLHVVEPWDLHFSSGADVPQPLGIPERTAQAERKLRQLRGVYESRATIETKVLVGGAAQVICDLAGRESVGAIVLCTHGHAGLSTTRIGSVAERVVQDASCPVLVVRPPKDATGQFVMLRVEHKLKEILVGFDHRSGATEALKAALDMAKGHSVKITLVHALEPPPPAMGELMRPVDASLIEKAKAWLNRVVEVNSAPGVEWGVIVAAGYPWMLLIDTAKSHGSDLVVVGPHDHAGWRHCFLGSTAQRVVRLAPCSVLAVK